MQVCSYAHIISVLIISYILSNENIKEIYEEKPGAVTRYAGFHRLLISLITKKL